MAILITGGTVVNSTGSSTSDVLIDGERIVAVVDSSSDYAATLRSSGAEIIDATDRLVVPGGVDPHVHLQLPMMPQATSSDTFETGTRAAAWGGTTTVIDFAGQIKGSGASSAVDERHAEAAGQCAIDYGFHLSMGDVNDQSLKEMRSLVDEGITTFKFYMAYPGAWYSDDGQILQAMQVVADTGAMAMMHAENGIAIDVLRDQAVRLGNTGSVWHGRTRPAILEGEATHRAIALATVAGAPLYIVHLSASEALEQVVIARDRGRNVFAETCPQYLYLTIEQHLDQPGINGLRHICSPPLRSSSDGDSLWRGLRTDDLSVVSTDHCPFCDSEKLLGVDDFRETPNGLGSIEHRMDLLHQGVVAGEISLARWVEVCSTTPARLFGLQGRKGIVAPGADADIVIYDPSVAHTLSVDSNHMASDNSVWEGTVVQGQSQSVMSRGSWVIRDRTYVGHAGHGQFLKRGISDVLR